MKVFISYSRLDASETAKAIHNYLTEIGHHEVFIDTSDIHGGDEWRNTIQNEISDCDIFVIIVTFSALLREEVGKEVELAKKMKKRIIPCIARKYVKREDILWELNDFHGIEFEKLDDLNQDLLYMINVEAKTQIDKSNLSFGSEKQDLKIKYSLKYLEKAKVFERLKQNQRALINYDEAIKIDSDNFEALFSKVLLLFKMEKFDEALQSIERAIDLQPENQDVWYYKGIILEKLKIYDEALEALKTDLHIDDKDIKSWTSKAKLLEQMERYIDALEAIDEIINIDSANIDALEQKGKIFEKLKRYEDAINCYDKVLFIDANNKEAIKNKMILEENLKKQRYSEIISKLEPLFYQQKDHSTVITLCDEAIDIDKENHVAYLYKANSLLQLIRYEEAIRCYDKVLFIDANNKEAIKNKKIILEIIRKEEIKSSYENKDYSKVIELCNEIKESDNNPVLQIYKGDASYHLGDYQQALQYYDKVLEIEPDNAYALNKRKIAREQLYKQLTDSKTIKQVFEKAWSIEIIPRYIAVDPNGYVYVTSTETKSETKIITYRKFLREKQETIYTSEYYSFVYKFDSEGKFIAKWGSYGTGDGQCDNPRGIFIDSSNNVYVTDTNNHHIQKFDSEGKFIAKWGSYGTGDGEFKSPNAIAVDSKGYVYVTDTNNHHIQKFDSEGKFIAKWGREDKGTGDGEFHYPSDISVDSSTGYVYVADTYNYRIQKFDSDGNFITKWGGKGTGDGQFDIPFGIAVDSKGYVYVADTYNYHIQKFDSDGNFITKWGGKGTGDGQFDKPYGIAVDFSTGYVYVSEPLNHRIQVFAPAPK